MWTQASALLLMLACCLWPAEGQSNDGRRQNIWEDPIKFNTKANDLCTMIITGQGEHTRLRLSCQGSRGSYWCEYLGKPNTCRSYNNNPRHYFTQMMWDLRKLHNACHAPRQIKPHMCRKATDESQMVFSSSSFSQSFPVVKPARPQRPATMRPNLEEQVTTEVTEVTQRPELAGQASTEATEVTPRSYWAEHDSGEAIEGTPMEQTEQIISPEPTAPHGESDAKRMARLHCWRSLQGVCTYVIGWFRD